MPPGPGVRSGPGGTATGPGGTATGPGGTAGTRRRPPWLVPLVLVALAVLAGAASAFAFAPGENREQAVTVRTAEGRLIARTPLEGETFAVSYRNSIYGTLAEERYRVLPDGRFELVEIAADQVAVLEEYYAVPGAPRPAPDGDRRGWVVEPDPDRPAVFTVLNIAATDLGERTLWVPGHPPVPVWQHVVSENPTVLLNIEEST